MLRYIRMKVQTKEISVAEQLAVKEESSVKKDVVMKEISESKVCVPTKWLKCFYLPSLSCLSCVNVSVEIDQKAPVVQEVKDVLDKAVDLHANILSTLVEEEVKVEKKEKNRLSLKSDKKNSPIAA